MSMYEVNMKMIERRIREGLRLLRENYRVTEIDTYGNSRILHAHFCK